jgi:hypothetical protein
MEMSTRIMMAAALAATMGLPPAQAAETARAATPASERPVSDEPEKAQLKGEPAKPAPVICTPSWTAKKYKPFGKVQNEIKKRYGDVRILRVALCGEGADAYFQIVIISGAGSVSRVQIAASN